MIRPFTNANTLSRIVIISRLRQLDPLAECDVIQTVLIVDGVVTTQPASYVNIDSTLSNEQIEGLLATPVTAAETAIITNFVNSITSFETIDADWPTKSAADLVAGIRSAFFGGLTLQQKKNQVAQVDTFPEVQAALNQILDEMYAGNERFIKVVLAVAYLRDRLMRLKR